MAITDIGGPGVDWSTLGNMGMQGMTPDMLAAMQQSGYGPSYGPARPSALGGRTRSLNPSVAGGGSTSQNWLDYLMSMMGTPQGQPSATPPAAAMQAMNMVQNPGGSFTMPGGNAPTPSDIAQQPGATPAVPTSSPNFPPAANPTAQANPLPLAANPFPAGSAMGPQNSVQPPVASPMPARPATGVDAWNPGLTGSSGWTNANPLAGPGGWNSGQGAPGSTGGATGSSATSNPRNVPGPMAGNRFTTIHAPNVDPLRRAQMGNPQTTALNLAGLFGGNRAPAGGGQAVNPDVPAANARPVSLSGPLAKAPLPPMMAPADLAELRRRASLVRMNAPYTYTNT